MKFEVPFRIILLRPPAGVAMKVQKGRDELIEPVRSSADGRVFEFPVRVDLAPSLPNFLGPFAQGPKDGRYIYINSGACSGQSGTPWSRRAKLSLMSISRDAIEEVLASPNLRIETSLNGTGRDGGPVCASVKGLEWRVAGNELQ